MLESKRKFKRFNLPIVVSFRTTYGATEKSVGLMKNFSCEGLAIEAKNFSFIKYENLELNLKFPQHTDSSPLFGNVIWKRHNGGKCTAGIKLKTMDGTTRDQLLEKVSSFGKIPVDELLFSNDVEIANNDVKVEPAEQLSGKKRKSSKNLIKTGFTKQYCKGGAKCIVTFRLHGDAAPDVDKVTIVGDFNNWDATKTTMKKLKNGGFQATLELDSNMEYKFKYLIDGTRWENDWAADKYVSNEYGADDSVVIV